MIYEEHKKSSLWRIIETEIKSLEKNQDLKITTVPDYIIGALVKSIRNDPILNENIAESLWKIHSHSLYPYYENKKENEESWEQLIEIENDRNEVSKTFFRQIAKNIFDNKA